MLCNYLQLQRKDSGQVLLDLGLDFELLGQFFCVFFFPHNLFSLFAFYTHETLPQRREQQLLHLRGKTFTTTIVG